MIPLDLPGELHTGGGPSYLDWLGAYPLKEHTTEHQSIFGDALPFMYLLNPDGRLLVLNMRMYGLQEAQPTRAGMVVSIFTSKFGARHDGLYLWRKGGVVQITEGTALSSRVSPDGCKIAFTRSPRETTTAQIESLRIVDLCKAFNVPADANPFEWGGAIRRIDLP